MTPTSTEEWVTDALFRARTGDRVALARMLTMVEHGGNDARLVARAIQPAVGDAYTVGLTGAPGAGKSTLSAGLIGHLRKQGLQLGVIAIDPTSPFSGGAILGDRVRMQEHATDAGVFIRSIATRGHLGGLAVAVPEAIRLFSAVGKACVLVETVGVGQVEVEIARQADTTIVVVNPGWGDSIQANKAGLLEIADVFVINKADRNGADQSRRDLEQMLDLSGHLNWRPPIVETVATESTGIDIMWEAVLQHRAYATESGVLDDRRRHRTLLELENLVAARLGEIAKALLGTDALSDTIDSHRNGTVDLWTVSDRLLAPLGLATGDDTFASSPGSGPRG